MKNKSHMEKIKEHFENEAVKFDEIICRLIPYYDEMLESAAVLAISKARQEK